MHEITVTKEEQKAIASLKRLAKKWPDSISLFSWSGSLQVFKEVDGKSAVIESIGDAIPNDGGDPNYDEDVWDDGDVEIEYE